MHLQANMIDITPLKPVLQGGYRTRDHVYENVHDPIIASIFILTILEERYIWIGIDVSNGTTALIDEVLMNLKLHQVHLDKDHLIFGGSHTHSGPNIYVEREPDKADKDYFQYAGRTIAEGIIKTMGLPKHEVAAKYAKIEIDGLYSNRNTKDKLCDKFVHCIGFFERDKLIAIHVTLSHHCTLLGPDNFSLSADLFGALRKKFIDTYQVPVLMAQGNAGDMGNRQYRSGNGFEALAYQAEEIYKQIQAKLEWRNIALEAYHYHHYVYHAIYTIDATMYDEELRLAEAKLKVAKDVDEQKILLSEIRGYQRKQEQGSGVQHLDMPVEIIDMMDVQLIIIPGELSSYLGMKIKQASPFPHCIIWGYANGAHLGYLIDGDGYDHDSFESRISVYPKGVADGYTEFIMAHLSKKMK